MRAAAFSRSSSLAKGRAAASQAPNRGAGSNSMAIDSMKAGTETPFNSPTVGNGAVLVSGKAILIIRVMLPVGTLEEDGEPIIVLSTVGHPPLLTTAEEHRVAAR